MTDPTPPASSPAPSRPWAEPPAALQTLSSSRPLVAILAGLAGLMALVCFTRSMYGLFRHTTMVAAYESAGWGIGFFLFQSLWQLVEAGLFLLIAFCLYLHQSATRDLLDNRSDATLQTVLRYQHLLWQVAIVMGVLTLANWLFSALYLAQAGVGL